MGRCAAFDALWRDVSFGLYETWMPVVSLTEILESGIDASLSWWINNGVSVEGHALGSSHTDDRWVRRSPAPWFSDLHLMWFTTSLLSFAHGTLDTLPVSLRSPRGSALQQAEDVLESLVQDARADFRIRCWSRKKGGCRCLAGESACGS